MDELTRGAYSLIEEGRAEALSVKRPLWPYPRKLNRTCRTRRPLIAALGTLLLISSASLVFVFCDIQIPNAWRDLQSGLGIEPPTDFELRIINATRHAPPSPRLDERPTLGESFFTPECLDNWIAYGTLCEHTREKGISQDMRDALKLSVVHTWVNGSDLALQEVKKVALAALPPGPRLWGPTRVGNLAAHFRSHDELRYSLRSVIRSLPLEDIAGLHIVTADLPVGSGQRPTWLKDEFCGPTVQIHHHSEIFRLRGENVSAKEAQAWIADNTPSFNSIGIETQLGTLAPNLTDTVIYFNDDFFLSQELERTDFYTPLFGPVFRMQSDLKVAGTPRGGSRTNPDGEWPSIGYANWLLDQRFGERKRPYLQHFVKTYSAPLLEEVTAIWAQELTESAEVRFRGRGKGSTPDNALGLAHLATHYVVERHREALLWSFLIVKSDVDNSTTFSADERHLILTSIGFNPTANTEESLLLVPYPVRSASASNMEPVLADVGLDTPKQTSFSFTSHGSGFAYSFLEGIPELISKNRWLLVRPKNPPNHGWPEYSTSSQGRVSCTMNARECFGDEFLASEGDGVSVEDTFKRLAFVKPRCGDCIISSLLGTSGLAGFSSFLPDPVVNVTPSERVALSFAKSWKNARFDSVGGRARAVSLLQRYAYTLGDSPAEFAQVKTGPAMPKLFKKLSNVVYQPNGPAFLTLNDDIHDTEKPERILAVDQLMKEWFEETWPDKTCWEV